MKLIRAIILFSLSYSLAYGAELKIGFTNSNNLVLRSNSCSKLVKQHQAICSWKKTLTPSFETPVITQNLCKQERNNRYKMTISDCLPEFVKAQHHKKLYKSGANCWGTALNFKELSLKPRFVWQEEMRYWINSPLCRKLEVGERLLPGDIINTYGPEHVFGKSQDTAGVRFWKALFPDRFTPPLVDRGRTGFDNLLHSETFLTSELTFGKDSPNKLDKFEFHNMNEVYGRSRDAECQEAQEITPFHREYQRDSRSASRKRCDYFSLAYRCSSFSDFLVGQKLTPDEQVILNNIMKLQKQQEKLFPLISKKGFALSSSQISKILIRADQVASNSLDDLTIVGLSERKEVLLVLQYFTAAALRKSLELADLTPATEPL